MWPPYGSGCSLMPGPEWKAMCGEPCKMPLKKKRKKESGCLRNDQPSVGPNDELSVGPIGQLSVGLTLCGEPWASCHHWDIFSSKTRLSGEPCALPHLTITL